MSVRKRRPAGRYGLYLDRNDQLVSVVKLRLLTACAMLSLLLSLGGCATRDFARGASTDELAGRWTLTQGAESAQLTLDEDGTFRAEGWPQNLMCTDVARNVEDISWSDTVDFGGQWKALVFDYALSFKIEDPRCNRYGWDSNVWALNGKFEMEIFLSGASSADTARDDEIIWVKKSD